jgi:cytosine/adenosine deaminase-related metal-dependent hydrolase
MDVLIKDLDYVATFDDDDNRLLQGASIGITGPEITTVGKVDTPAEEAIVVIDGSGKIALPGFVNTHHHFFQQLTRAVPAVHCSSILDWLGYLYPIWAEVDEEAMRYATLLAGAQLLLTGCTTTSDMAYFYPHGRSRLIDVEIEAIQQLGMRFHPCRAGIPAMEGDLYDQLKGQGVPVDDLVEDPDSILSECERVITAYHDPAEYSMCRVAIGQTDKAYRDPDFMRAMADLAERYDVLLHTHLHPRDDEVVLCQELHQMEPLDFMDETGWLGPRLWLAHATGFSEAYVERVARAEVGISHSPSSNMRLGYPVAPVPAMIAAGVKVSVGVDGGASNDTGDYVGELRQTMLVHRIAGIHPVPYGGSGAVTPHDVLQLGTRGGSAVLHRQDLGALQVGRAADIALFDLHRLDYAGALHDPLAALVFCGESHRADTTIVNGKVLVSGGRLTQMDEKEIAVGANRHAARLMQQAGVLH